MTADAQEQERPQATTEIAERGADRADPVPLDNGVLSPDRWAMFGRIANTIAKTQFVPKDLRGNAPAVMAVMLYGDALGLHPSVALTEVHIIDGRPGISNSLMVAKVRQAGHKIRREEIRNPEGEFLGVIAHGERGDNATRDSFTFTLEMAKRADLYPKKDNWKKYPEAMCWARACSQICRMLFSDAFLGQSVYEPEELAEVADSEALRNGERGEPKATIVEDKITIPDDPLMAARLNDLFAKIEEFAAGKYLPAKRRLLVTGKDADELQKLVTDLEAEIVDAGHEVPPAPDPAEFAEEPEAVEAEVVDEDIAFGEGGEPPVEGEQETLAVP